MKKRFADLFVILLLLLALCAQAAAASILDPLCGLLGTDDPLGSDALVAGDSVSDWTAFLAGRLGETTHREVYLDKLWRYVSEQYQVKGGLDAVRATQWHRVALTVLALGADPTCFGTDADGKPVDLIADGTYGWETTQSLGTQGLNGWIFALLTLDARQYTPPTDAAYTREDMFAAILAAQEADGGFGLSAGQSDVDITAMALQALAPYRASHAEAIERALDFLSAAQTARGDYDTGAESCAQVILALCALGLDPRTEPRFVKAGGSVYDGLLLYQAQSGAFCHTLDTAAQPLSTQQAALALLAVERGGSVYDLTDISVEPYVYRGSRSAQPRRTVYYLLGGAAAVLLLAGGLLLWKKKTSTRE